MAFLFDTIALSELTRKVPNAGFLAWLSAHSAEESYIGTPSIGELEIGIELLEPSKKRSTLETWLAKLLLEFRDRILAFDLEAARQWGRAIGHARRSGIVLPQTDSQIAAIASVHGLTIVTRNVRHFATGEFHDLDVVNPWN